MHHPSLATGALTPMSLSIDVSGWSDDQVNRLRSSAHRIGLENAAHGQIADDGEVENTGWTEATYLDAVTGLLSKHHVQVAVVFEAAKTNNPFVSRARVYELGSYPATRSLKGFTRPVNRVQQDLVDAGRLPDDAADLLGTVYDPTAPSSQRAIGFRVPVEVIRIAQAARARQEEQSQNRAG